MEEKSPFSEVIVFFQAQASAEPGEPAYNAAFCEQLVRAASAQEASIWQLDRSGRLYLMYGTNVAAGEIQDVVLRQGEGISGAAALSRQAIAVAEAEAHPLHDQRVDERIHFQTHSMISAPVLFGDFLYGVVNILNHRSGREFPEEWKEWMAATGVLYAAALASAGRLRSYEAPTRKKAGKALKPLLSAPGTTTVVGISRPVQEALHLCLKAGRTSVPVLIRGETGTGKELAARRIHEASDRVCGPFLEVNCAALTETLLESELFGHVKGAFTGAIRDRQGKFVAASGGTLFLDEIGEMSPASQAKILRALEEKKVVPVGSEKAVAYDARIIAATNQQLLKRVEQKKFRQDLYYRLCGLEIVMPPLRERVQDIALLAMHFLQKACGQPGTKAPEKTLRLSNQALDMLVAFHWPGNVRQLEQAVCAAAAICEGEEIEVDDFPAWLRTAVRSQGVTPASSTEARRTAPSSEPPALVPGRAGAGDERARYLKALDVTRYPGTGRWNLSAAARKLRIPRKTLIYRLRKLGVLS